jgi:hypothetical protein
MPTVARKPATAPAAGAPAQSDPAAADPVLAEDVEGPEPSVQPFGVEVVFNGPITLVVAGVGLCEPGVVYPVPEAVAALICRGEPPLFVRVAGA